MYYGFVQALSSVDDEDDPKESMLVLLTQAERERRAKASHAARKRQFVQHFRNTSLILDCVSCEKCRLWGKLQVLGLGTALKILLSEADGVRMHSVFSFSVLSGLPSRSSALLCLPK